MPRLISAASFRSDIDAVLHYLEEIAGPVADRYAGRFRATIDRLVQFPRSGAPRPMLGVNAHVVVIPPYILIYDCGSEDGTLVLLRVLHKRHEITQDTVRRPE